MIGHGLLGKTGQFLKKLDLGKDAVVITNNRLLKLYGGALSSGLKRSGFKPAFITVPDSEKAKSIAVAASVLSRIAAHDKYKNIFLIAMGGGVVGDLTGFVASIYKRGIPYIQIPTTLLAQVDSSIGGKTAIDLPAAKNLVGAFYQPKIVISDVSVLTSLPKRRMISAMAEIIKYGVIKDSKLFGYLEKNYSNILNGNVKALESVIARSSAIKAGVVEKDEFDNKGVRATLNYGHTIGHAVEAASAYSGLYDHGESVAIGMAAAVVVSLNLKLIKPSDARRILSLIAKCGLPLDVKSIKLTKIREALSHDKKFIHGINRFILPAAIGKVRIVEDVPERIVKDAILAHLK